MEVGINYDSAATLVVAAGLVAGLAAGLVGGYRAGLAVALELWLAAGLLRLVGTPTWPRIATAATVMIIRRLANRGLMQPPPFGPRSFTGAGGHRRGRGRVDRRTADG